MTKSFKKLIGEHPFVFLVCLAFLLYLPIFVVPFSFHNDGSIVSGGGGLWNAFDEGYWIFMIGRPLYTLYLSLQAHLINTVTGLSWGRLLSFIAMIPAVYIFWRFLERRCGVAVFWTWLMTLIYFFIPANLLSLVWCEEQAVGPVTLSLANLSYVALDAAFDNMLGRKSRSFLFLILSTGMFFSALCIYPASALVVFAFTFARLLFSSTDDTHTLRLVIIRDLVFFGSLMGLYLKFVKAWIIPWGVEHFHMDPPGGLYAFSVTFNLASKWSLLVSILGYSLRGLWDFAGSTVGTWIVLIIFVSIYIARRDVLRASMTDPSFVERTGWAILLFLAANATSLLAGGCVKIVGYRILLASTIMGMFLTFKLFMKTKKALAVTVTACMIVLAMWIEVNMVRNNYLEYALAMEQLKKVDFQKNNRLLFILNRSGQTQTLLGQPLPLDTALMSVSAHHAAAYLREFLKRDPGDLFVESVRPGGTMYMTAKTALIDLTITPDRPSADLAHQDVVTIRPTSLVSDQLLVDASDTYCLLLSFQTADSGHKYPYWIVLPQEKTATLELDANDPKTLSNYACDVEARDAAGVQKAVEWTLQGSDDGVTWANIDVKKNDQSVEQSKAKVYRVKAEPFKRHRFLFTKDSDAQVMMVHGMKLLFN